MRFFSASFPRSRSNARMRSRRSASSSGAIPSLRRAGSAGGSSANMGRLRAERRCMSTTLTVTRCSHVLNLDCLEVLQALVNLDEDLLNDVLEVAAGAEHPVHEPGDVDAMAVVQASEGVRVAGDGTGDQLVLARQAGLHGSGRGKPLHAHDSSQRQDARHVCDARIHHLFLMRAPQTFN